MKGLLLAMVVFITACLPVFAAHTQAPDWMHALVGASVPTHDEKTDAVLLYSEQNLTVLSADRFRTTVREAYKILRPEGRRFGTLIIPFDSLHEKVTSIRGWCIPAASKDYEVTDKDAVERSPLLGESMELVTDERVKTVEIPAPDPGNIVGYEYVLDQRPLTMQDLWEFQDTIPVKEAHYSLTLPAGWEFKDTCMNYPEVKVHDAGGGTWQWSVGDLPAIRMERDMPPWQGVAAQMIVSLFPPGGAAANSFPTWRDLGAWQNRLASGRRDASPEIKQQVAALTASAPAPLGKMRAIAAFVQTDIRYVAIELGIGGWQPHPAADIYAHRYGDCKDKVNLTIAMMREIGVEAYDVRINVRRGAVTSDTPPHLAFNHSITTIRIPDGAADSSLVATIKHPALGTILFFDPTDEMTPFGRIRGDLQSNYGLLLTSQGGELVKLPQQPAGMNGIERTAKFILTADGTLQGDVEEVRVGDRAEQQREMFNAAKKDTDHIKPVEELLADSLASYRLASASVGNLKQLESPFVWDYAFQARDYAKFAGNLLLVRPRVLGRKSNALLENPEPRRYPIEFSGPVRDTDIFDITLPHGYVVDDLPPAVDADYPFASYHAKSEVVGNVLRYHRTFEVKELSVPVSDAPQLQKFYRIIASDERNTAVLKPSGSP